MAAIVCPLVVYELGTVVARHLLIPIPCGKCKTVHTVTFDEVQRVITCPDCGFGFDVPAEFRGLP